MKVKIKKLHPDAVIPSYAKPGDAGMDLVALSEEWRFEYIEFGTGLSIEIPEGYVGLLFPRSSITVYELMLKNSVGVIDSGYRGEIKLRFQDVGRSAKFYERGDRIAQLIILPYPRIEWEEAQELQESERGQGGFGSTGKQ